MTSASMLDIVVVTHNSADVLPACLDSLIEEGLPSGVTLSVWDNASTDSSQRVAEVRGCTVISSETNIGFAAASNAAARRTSGSFVMFVNPDCLASHGFVNSLVTLLRDRPSLGLAAPRIENPDGTPQQAAPGLPTPASEIRYALAGRHGGHLGSNTETYLSGACLIASRAAWLALGGFDERYFLYGEDADLSRRALDLGIPIETLDSVAIRHDGSQGLGSKRGPSLQLLISGKVSYFDRFHGRFAALAVLAAYRVGALQRAALALATGRTSQASMWWKLARLKRSSALWFGSEKDTRPLRVIGWPGLRQTDRNPYTVELYRAMRAAGADVGDLGQIHRLIARADAVHIHWPEAVLNVRSPIGAIYRATRLFTLVRIMQVRGASVVWTVHNLRPHDGTHPRLGRIFLNRWTRMIDAAIFNSEASRREAVALWPHLEDLPHLISSLPSYRGLHDPTKSRAETRMALNLGPNEDLLLFVGTVRRYKKVESLIAAYGEARAHDSELRLLIAGAAQDEEYRRQLRDLADSTPGTSLQDEFLRPEDVGNLLGACDLLVLPLEDALNSSSVVLGMSYDTPVLAPRTTSNEELLERYPQAALTLYEPPLRGDHLINALGSTPSPHGPTPLPSFRAIASAQLGFLRNLAVRRR